MRNEKGQFLKGMTGNPLGRPKRAEEAFLVDLWTEHGQRTFTEAVKGGEQWALKVLMDKLFANKKESMLDVVVRQEPRPLLYALQETDDTRKEEVLNFSA